MHAKYFLVDERGDWKTIEAVGEDLPKLDSVPALAFVVEAIDSVD